MKRKKSAPKGKISAPQSVSIYMSVTSLYVYRSDNITDSSFDALLPVYVTLLQDMPNLMQTLTSVSFRRRFSSTRHVTSDLNIFL